VIEHKQLHYHKPEFNEIGDCWRTCVACILNVPPHTIPHHYKEMWQGTVDIAQEVHKATNVLLRERYGIQYVEYPISCTLEELKTYCNHYYHDHHVMIGCNSIHGGHSVIMRNDDYMWDPAIDNSGCVGPMKDGYFWIGLLVAIN